MDHEITFEVNVGDRVFATEIEVDPGPQIDTVVTEDQHIELETTVNETLQTETWTEEIPFNVIPVKGDKGDKGDPGTINGTFEGTAWFTGDGVPDVVLGSKPGDYYIDRLTGTFYKLGD